MGGQSYNDNGLDSTIAKAKTLTDAQIEAAIQLHIKHFDGADNPEVLAAIIQALASNYALVASR